MTLAVYVLAVAILALTGAILMKTTDNTAAMDRLTASVDALHGSVGALVSAHATTTAELRSIATDNGDTDTTIRLNALADKVDADVAAIVDELKAKTATEQPDDAQTGEGDQTQA